MVLLTTLAMHAASTRPSRDDSSSSPQSGMSNSMGYVHTNGYFYSPSHTEDTPTLGYSHQPPPHRKGRRYSNPALGSLDMTSSVTSPGVYSSLTNLDTWSPNTVSVSSLLRHHSGDLLNKPTSGSNNNGFAHVNGGGYRSGDSDSESYSLPYSPTSTSSSTTAMPVAASCAREGIKDRSLRRTVSADPHHRNRDPYYPVSRPLGSTPNPAIPRVCSDGDLLESEYVTLDYAYRATEKGRESSSKKNTLHRKYSDITNNSSPSSSFSSSDNYSHYYSDENNYYQVNGYNSSSSSGYVSASSSGRTGSGSTGSLQRSGTLPTSSAIRSRTMSAERLWHQPRTMSPMERGRGTLPRKKSSQTLQTVAENIVQGLNPKSILKNGSNNNNGSGTNTPRSACSSRRSSINSRLGVTGSSLDSSSIVSSDFAASEPCSSSRVPPPPLAAPTPTTPLNSILVKHNDLNQTFGGTGVGSSDGKLKPDQHPHRLRIRSKSLSDLRQDIDASGSHGTGCYSDDEDGDDFGFLSHPFHTQGGPVSVSRPPTVMHKAKAAGGTSSPSHRLLPRRWRNKNKNSSVPVHPAQPMWSPEGPCTWCSVSGRKVIVKPVSILQLCEAERLALQKLALSKLQAMDLSCPIVIPKDASELRRQKKRALSLKRRSKSANLASLLDTLSSDKGKDKENKDAKPTGLVFGIPLSRCIANDRELVKRRARTQATALQARSDSADHLLSPRHDRKSSSSSQGSLDNGAQNGTMGSTNPCAIYDSARRAASSDSLSESDHSSRNTSSSLIEALSLQAPQGERGGSQAVGSTPQVPHIVDACFKHLETHGLQVLGIFRVGSSKKRVKQLREEFDSGKDLQLTEDHNPHDVGALLKEFFRDLPEPLLTRDLYLPFVASRKVADRETQAEAVRLLLTLLPPANRDTLWALLRFLATVHRHSSDSSDRNGREVAGNKMDSHNLATLFGPNILHRARAVNEKQFMAECAEQAEQSSEVISVVKDMIDNHYELFEISAAQRDEVLKLMLEADQENLDKVLRRLSNENQIEPDPESMCSVFEEGELTQSLPHSANSDADLLSLVRRKGVTHQPLRVSRSADPWTDPPQRANTLPPHPFSEGGRRVCSLDSASERCSQSPSPQDSPSGPFSPTRAVGSGTGSLPRPPVVTISQDGPEVVMRPSSGRRRGAGALDTASGVITRPLSGHMVVRERPHSETYAGSLNIPKPAYFRENSGASSASSSYLSSSGGHASDSSGHWVLPSPSGSHNASPQSQHRGTASRSQSQQGSRRRAMLTSSSRSDDDDGASPAVGSPEWQRERWRHWEQITAGRNGGAGDAEQETLV